MPESNPPEILILAADDSMATILSQWTEDLPCLVCLYNDPIPENVGVIQIDSPDSGENGGSEESSLVTDVCLPADVSRRELRTACRLLLEIVHLRRSLQTANKLGRGFKKAAFTDPLTGLPNRRDWQETLESRLEIVNTDRPLCLAVVDLDHFKDINTNYGHGMGDQVLKRVADSIRNSLRGDDFVARLGGDEFGLLFWVPNPQMATDIVERVREAIGRLSLDELFNGKSGQGITASAGFCVATYGISPDAFFTTADAAMNRAKNLGRNRTVAHNVFLTKAGM